MRWALVFALGAVHSFAQISETYVYDGLGQVMRGPETIAQGDSRTEVMRSINGRRVPLEQAEQRVLRDDGVTRVIELTVRRFDPNGQLASTERTVEEQTKLTSGGSTVHASTWRSDVNGNLQPFQRSVTETRKSGSQIVSDAVVERPSINGNFQTAEKRVTVDSTSQNGEARNTVVYRPDDNGRFYEAVKETVERETAGGKSVENRAQYAVGTSGRLELYSQTVKTAVKTGPESESIVVDVYAPETPGIANASSDRAPKLKEQQVIERRSSNGEVVETLSIRQPSLADPDRLGPSRRTRETVCRGKCDR